MNAGLQGYFRQHRTRMWQVIGTALAVLLLIVGAVVATRRRSSGTGDGARNAPAGAMADMPGMSSSSGGAVQLTAAQLRQFGVTFGSVEMRTLANDVRTVGVVTIDSSRLVQVTPKFAGFVERLHVDASGQAVRRGQPLMDVYSPELMAAEQELLVAANLQRSLGRTEVPGVSSGGADLVAAARRRLALWDISDAQIEEIVRSGRVRRALALRSPASGIVLEKNVVQGQAIQPGQMLYTVADLGQVWVDAQLREADAAAVRVGAGATLEMSALPGRPFKGRVTYVYPTLDAQARTVRARISVSNTDGLLRPGMYATVTLSSPSRTALTVPTSAVLRTGERNLVFVDLGGGRLWPQEVELGRIAGENTEVLAGVAPGQRVVTSAQFLLDAESNLAEVMRSMIGQRGSSDMGSMKDIPVRR